MKAIQGKNQLGSQAGSQVENQPRNQHKEKGLNEKGLKEKDKKRKTEHLCGYRRWVCFFSHFFGAENELGDS